MASTGFHEEDLLEKPIKVAKDLLNEFDRLIVESIDKIIEKIRERDDAKRL